MSKTIRAYAASAPGKALASISYDMHDLSPNDVLIRVESCGICHSDVSMLDNAWGMSAYPLVPGHEVIGTVVERGDQVAHLNVGQRVGLGWFAGSCMTCRTCMSGQHHLCGSSEQTIVGRHGGFADYVRCRAAWAVPLPAGVEADSAGPLFCGGITVFAPIASYGIKPTDRVGVVGIGGLGHLALQFLNKWGCEVTAFTSSEAKRAEAMTLGAHHAVDSRDSTGLAALAGSLDFILVTANVSLDWPAYISALAPRGRLHFVGAVLEPIPVSVFSLLGGQRSLSASPLGSPATLATMLDFCARHRIKPQAEYYPMSRVNDALEHLRAGKPRYRIVLQADFA
ncbi:MAG TPA: NAD(P)-dependent alcohol dehydrogenase [Kiritimatiellia bacterium]|nr:NAD(P)-dependent alcohol dehydrogenase [Kiritimatiellia bacterium]